MHTHFVVVEKKFPHKFSRYAKWWKTFDWKNKWIDLVFLFYNKKKSYSSSSFSLVFFYSLECMKKKLSCFIMIFFPLSPALCCKNFPLPFPVLFSSRRFRLTFSYSFKKKKIWKPFATIKIKKKIETAKVEVEEKVIFCFCFWIETFFHFFLFALWWIHRCWK